MFIILLLVAHFLQIWILTGLKSENLQWDATCHMTPSYPPDASRKLPWYTINLDKPASERWTEPVTALKSNIQQIVDLVLGSDAMKAILLDLEIHCDSVTDRFPNDWGEEIRSIANIVERECADIVFFNLLYEIQGLCTSIVAQNSETDHLYHGRNLDIGSWPKFNTTDTPDQWLLAEYLKKILFNANFTKNGTVLYQSVALAGYVGVLTGIKQNAMTISVDSRFDENHDKYLKDWFQNSNDNSQFLSFVTRTALENFDNFDDTVEYISQTSFVGPCYIIIGGVDMNDGAVITIGPNMTLYNYWDIPNALGNNSDASHDNWYVLETNYDHWEQPPWYDDRRYPCEDCMAEIGSDSIDFETLYNVLNGIPNRNRLTVVTVLMDCQQGTMESYIQYCDERNCSPW